MISFGVRSAVFDSTAVISNRWRGEEDGDGVGYRRQGQQGMIVVSFISSIKRSGIIMSFYYLSIYRRYVLSLSVRMEILPFW